MARVVSIHEYQLKPDADRIAFERAFRNAEERGLFGLPGLIEHHFLKGLKGTQQAGYSAVCDQWPHIGRPREFPVVARGQGGIFSLTGGVRVDSIAASRDGPLL
jgi:hypothetical protein